jgi:hypothetical protein
MDKYKAEFKVSVEFKDNGADDLNTQAMDALEDKHKGFGDYDLINVKEQTDE